jgi:very-short-patch-repair endonuclease
MSSANQSPSPSGRGARGEGRAPKIALPSDLLDFARKLRKEQTSPESLLWYLLRDRRLLGYKFRRQYPLPPYVLDFYCDELKLGVELDGGQHNADEHAARDERRDAFIRARGIEVVRYWNHDVLLQTEDVLEDLIRRLSLKARPSPPTPLPKGEGSGAGA